MQNNPASDAPFGVTDTPLPAAGIALSGEFDIAGVELWNRHTESWTRRQAVDVVVDLMHLQFIDATGMGALVGFQNALRAAGHRLHLRHPVPRVRRAFAAARLDHLITP